MELAKEFMEGQDLFGSPRLFYLWGHSYEFAMDQNWKVLEDLLAYMTGHKDALWLATNGMIVRYIATFNSLIFSADGCRVYNPSNLDVWLEAEGETYQIKSDSTERIG